MDLLGLAKDWDSDSAVRQRIRANKKLCAYPANQSWCEPNRPNCIRNHIILAPCLRRMRDHAEWKLPYLEGLQEEVGKLFESGGVAVDSKVIYTGSVEVKRMLSFVKRRASRKEVTKDRFSKMVFEF